MDALVGGLWRRGMKPCAYHVHMMRFRWSEEAGQWLAYGVPKDLARQPTRREQAKSRIAPHRYAMIAESGSTCAHCGRTGNLLCDPDGVAWNLDHLVPLSRGGSIERDNVVVSCRRCNREKGQWTLEEWRHANP